MHVDEKKSPGTRIMNGYGDTTYVRCGEQPSAISHQPPVTSVEIVKSIEFAASAAGARGPPSLTATLALTHPRYTQCEGHQLAYGNEFKPPPCWDHNTTVNATNGCVDANGFGYPTCLAIGYTSTAFIVQCGGNSKDDEHCGTFIELHPKVGTARVQALNEKQIKLLDYYIGVVG